LIDAETEVAVRSSLAANSWARMGLLRVAEVTPWQILLGSGSAGWPAIPPSYAANPLEESRWPVDLETLPVSLYVVE
jgi:hypothetical protein